MFLQQNLCNSDLSHPFHPLKAHLDSKMLYPLRSNGITHKHDHYYKPRSTRAQDNYKRNIKCNICIVLFILSISMERHS